MPKLRVMVTSLLVVSLMVFAVSMAMVQTVGAAVCACTYTGHAFLSGDDSVPVLENTGIRVMDGLTVMGETTTGPGPTQPFFDDNQYYLEVEYECLTAVSYLIEDAPGSGTWVSAVETATQTDWGYVVRDLHTGVATMHIDANPWLLVYEWADCGFPQVLTNIGPPTGDCPTGDPGALNCVILVWGTEDVGPGPGEEWVSYSTEDCAGSLLPFGMEQGKPYVITHNDCVCTDWEMYIP